MLVAISTILFALVVAAADRVPALLRLENTTSSKLKGTRQEEEEEARAIRFSRAHPLPRRSSSGTAALDDR